MPYKMVKIASRSLWSYSIIKIFKGKSFLYSNVYESLKCFTSASDTNADNFENLRLSYIRFLSFKIDLSEICRGNFSSSKMPQEYERSSLKVSEEISLSLSGLYILKSSHISYKLVILSEAPAIKSVILEFQRSRSSILLSFLFIRSTFFIFIYAFLISIKY